jgi:hypothetical protein
MGLYGYATLWKNGNLEVVVVVVVEDGGGHRRLFENDSRAVASLARISWRTETNFETLLIARLGT